MLEVGAAVMVEANTNLRKVAAMFGLPLIKIESGAEDAKMNIWDGNNIVYSTAGVSWWDKLTSVIRYGFFSPSRQAAAVTKFVNRMAKAYAPSFLAERGTVSSIEEFAASLQLGSEYAGQSGYDWATRSAGVSSRWANEMLDAMTRSNFGGDITEVSGMAAVAGASVTDAILVIIGGNNQLFQAMLHSSGADVRLSTEVSDVAAAPNGGYVVSSSNSPGNDTFDEVFWGNPWHLSPVAKSLEFETPIPAQEYVKVHVTFVSTTASGPNPAYFKQGAREMGGTIMTTGQRARAGGTGPSFQVILPQYVFPWGETVFQLFSHDALADAELRDLFGDTIAWTHRKEWDAYPLLRPTGSYPPVEPRAGFHYLAAMEPWLSTMETQTISAREAVARAVEGWWGLGLAQCAGASSWDLACEPAPPRAPTYAELVGMG